MEGSWHSVLERRLAARQRKNSPLLFDYLPFAIHKLKSSSRINLGMVIYPSKSGFDTWEKLGNQGWDWKSIEPYFRKSHTYTAPGDKTKEDLMLDYVGSDNGVNGPLQISFGSGEGYTPFCQAWPRAWRNLHKPINGDPISGVSTGAFNNPATMHPETRERSHAGNAYFSEEVAKRPNLRVVTEALVHKILLAQVDGTLQASGVEFAAKDGQTRKITADHKVVLAAGAVKTPQLLELSGIGNKDILAKNSIECLVENAGVGENLQDHGYVPFSWEVADPMTSGDQLRNPAVMEALMGAFQAAKAGPLSVNGLASAFFPLLEQDPAGKLVPGNVSKLLEEVDQTSVQPQVLREQICSPEDCSAQFTLAPFQLNPEEGHSPAKVYGMGTDGFYASMVAVLNHPFSRGSTHIQSSNAADAPLLDPRTMSHPLDLELHARHVLVLEKLRDTEPLNSLFKKDGRRLHNGDKRVETLEEAKKMVAERYTPHYHICGTAAMMPREKGGVVDAELNVYGVQGLKVVDASIFPLIPRGNIQMSVFAVAEKAADLLKSDWQRK